MRRALGCLGGCEVGAGVNVEEGEWWQVRRAVADGEEVEEEGAGTPHCAAAAPGPRGRGLGNEGTGGKKKKSLYLWMGVVDAEGEETQLGGGGVFSACSCAKSQKKCVTGCVTCQQTFSPPLAVKSRVF